MTITKVFRQQFIPSSVCGCCLEVVGVSSATGGTHPDYTVPVASGRQTCRQTGDKHTVKNTAHWTPGCQWLLWLQKSVTIHQKSTKGWIFMVQTKIHMKKWPIKFIWSMWMQVYYNLELLQSQAKKVVPSTSHVLTHKWIFSVSDSVQFIFYYILLWANHLWLKHRLFPSAGGQPHSLNHCSKVGLLSFRLQLSWQRVATPVKTTVMDSNQKFAKLIDETVLFSIQHLQNPQRNKFSTVMHQRWLVFALLNIYQPTALWDTGRCMSAGQHLHQREHTPVWLIYQNELFKQDILM